MRVPQEGRGKRGVKNESNFVEFTRMLDGVEWGGDFMVKIKALESVRKC